MKEDAHGHLCRFIMRSARTWARELPDALVAAIPGLGRDPLVTFDRNLGAERGKVLLPDMDHPLVRHLLTSARHYDFEGLTGAIALDGPSHVVTGMLRWQDERGQRLRREYIAVAVEGESGASVNPKVFSDWLLQPADSVAPKLEADTRNAARGVVDAAMDAMLAQRASSNLHPESREWLTAAWCTTPAGARVR